MGFKDIKAKFAKATTKIKADYKARQKDLRVSALKKRQRTYKLRELELLEARQAAKIAKAKASEQRALRKLSPAKKKSKVNMFDDDNKGGGDISIV